MLEWDQTQHLLAAIEQSTFDVLILDFIDERFALLRRPDDSVVTLSAEYMRCATRPLVGSVVGIDGESRHALWKAGLEVLLSALREKGALKKLLVNRVFWAESDADGRSFDAFAPDQIHRANQFLARCYADLETHLEGRAFINYPREMLVADRNHRWGISPYHFIPAFYEYTRLRLAEFVAQNDAPVSSTSPPSVQAAPAPAPAATSSRQVAVSTRTDDSGLVATIAPAMAASNRLFAFYLFRGDVRIAQTEYGPTPSTCFPIPNIPGQYRVAAFCRDRKSGSIERFTGSSLTFPDKADYDTTRWHVPAHVHPASDALAPVDGIHSFHGSGPTSLDFLLQDFDRLQRAEAILVCFNGAVSQRSKKTGPFFAGTSIARRVGLPVICVADPTLARARDLALAWYAGSDDHPELPQVIARHLDAVAAEWNRPLILLGGSGGAYATLSVARHLRVQATAVACNPQTSIHRYFPHAVARYVERAFPAVARRMRIAALPPAQLSHELLAQALSTAGVSEDLTIDCEPNRQAALILQNATDRHHVEQHLSRLVEAAGARWTGARLAYRGDRFAAWLGNWGEGHAAAPPSLVEWAVKQVAAGHSARSIAAKLDSRFGASPFAAMDVGGSATAL